MSIGININNAFEVVIKTHENVKKLMDYCINTAKTEGKFPPVTEKFLRWREDNNFWSWSTQSVALLFQDASNGDANDIGWRDGPIYVLFINLYDSHCGEPMVNIAKYEYESIFPWTSSPSHHYIYAQPLFNEKNEVTYTYDEDEIIYTGIITNPASAKRWNGLRKITGFEIPLIEITAENANDKIFGGFDKLKDM
jgi:hypothetical protein